MAALSKKGDLFFYQNSLSAADSVDEKVFLFII